MASEVFVPIGVYAKLCGAHTWLTGCVLDPGIMIQTMLPQSGNAHLQLILSSGGFVLEPIIKLSTNSRNDRMMRFVNGCCKF